MFRERLRRVGAETFVDWEDLQHRRPHFNRGWPVPGEGPTNFGSQRTR